MQIVKIRIEIQNKLLGGEDGGSTWIIINIWEGNYPGNIYNQEAFMTIDKS